MTRDPFTEYRAWERAQKRRRILWALATWLLLLLSAVGVLAIIGGMVILFVATFS